MSGTGAPSLFDAIPADVFLTTDVPDATEPPDLQKQLDQARNLSVAQFQEIERCHQMLDRIDPDPEPEFGELLDVRLARVLNLPLPTVPTVSEEDAR